MIVDPLDGTREYGEPGRSDWAVHAREGGRYEWDSAAPVAVAHAAGLHVSRIDGSESGGPSRIFYVHKRSQSRTHTQFLTALAGRLFCVRCPVMTGSGNPEALSLRWSRDTFLEILFVLASCGIRPAAYDLIGPGFLTSWIPIRRTRRHLSTCGVPNGPADLAFHHFLHCFVWTGWGVVLTVPLVAEELGAETCL